MAICKWCNQDMAEETTTSCTVKFYDDFEDGVARRRLPFKATIDERCHDCNVADGGLHHPGCDMEICPRCGGQAISCPCTLNEEEE